jgi:cysteine desulfurase / selenocysteine lyase
MSAATMNTGDPRSGPGGAVPSGPPAVPGPELTMPGPGPSHDELAAASMTQEIERLANQYFMGVPGPAVDAPPAVAPSPVVGGPVPIAPPNPWPSALAVGAGGASPAVMAPPVPGFVHRPPLAASPIPKESDLRTAPAMFADTLGTTPLALATTPTFAPGGSTPYFLDLAGPPQSPSGSGAPSAGASPWAAASPSAASPSVAASPEPGVPASSPSPLLGAYEFRPELVPDVDVASRPFDPHVIKRDFPILQERIHGRPLVWLDNAATTQKPQVVIDRVSYYYERENSNVHRGAHTLAARATDAFEAARDRVRRLLNAPSAKNIVWVRGATEGINLVAKSWGMRNVSAGDEIVITWLEHHANIVPWQQLCTEKGARLRVAPVDDRGQVKLDEYERLLGPRTRIVAFPQVSNALGTIVPAREMVEMAHRHGALVLVDGAQAVSHMPVDVQALDCDFYTFSGHKIFAPTGIGAVFGKTHVLESMPPWQGGGNMISDVTFEKTTYNPPPGRFEAGTGSIGDAVGLGAAIDYVMALGLENIQRYEHELRLYAEGELARVPGLTMIGTAPEKAGVMSFVLDGVRTEDVGGALDQEGIAVRSGHHCAQPILRRFGLESTVRASLAPYNTREDIDALVAALKRLQAGRPPR